MAVLPIVEVPDPRLRLISAPVAEVNDEVRDLIADMFDTMYDAPGIGLAAIQVGVPKRIVVMDLQEEEDGEGKPIRAPRVFINPEILDPADEHSVYTEGCLSIPEQFADVERPARCRVKWLEVRLPHDHGEACRQECCKEEERIAETARGAPSSSPGCGVPADDVIAVVIDGP